jgi:hypothetical protein
LRAREAHPAQAGGAGAGGREWRSRRERAALVRAGERGVIIACEVAIFAVVELDVIRAALGILRNDDTTERRGLSLTPYWLVC